MTTTKVEKTEMQNSENSIEAEVLRIWLVDDQDLIRQPSAQLLNMEPGVECLRDFSSAQAVLLGC